ncbi:helix-turn-helix domain-containing protein [Verrucomicrobiota bacterium sgz303538]
MNLCFEAGDRRRLRAAVSQAKEVRAYKRAQAVLWVAEGRSVSEAAQLARSSRRSVYYWCEAYLSDRSCRVLLEEKPRSGRPPSPASRITAQELEVILKRSPMELGYQSTGWTLALLATHLQREHGGERASCSTLRRRLHTLGWRWKRPRYVFAAPDPRQAQKKASDPQGFALSARRGTRLYHG